MLHHLKIFLPLICGVNIVTGFGFSEINRRKFISHNIVSVGSGFLITDKANASEQSLVFQESPCGIKWADAKVGSGSLTESVSFDYVMSTTGARYGSKIYSSVQTNEPYRFRKGDLTTIEGIELAIFGSEKDKIPQMLPGGIRRVVIPESLGYVGSKCEKGKGPVPSPSSAFEEYQRFKNIYCNPNRSYQPDLVMDIKLYGKRT